jgi:serine/threonine-protein phosphatase 4 regulatory subunit 1
VLDSASSLNTIFTLLLQLPRFVDLCEDEIWGVRKACAEVFMSVSCVCTLQTRKQNLAPLFTNLLVDQSRWVRMSAYKTLGPFISTFADPSITRLSYNQNGELVILGPDGFEFRSDLNYTSHVTFYREFFSRSGSGGVEVVFFD